MGTLLQSFSAYTGASRFSTSSKSVRLSVWPGDNDGSDLAREYRVNDDWVDLKQQVKEANDIVDVVGGYIPLRPAGPTFKGLCPFHEDKRPSFDVDPRRQRYRCWACSKFGDVISFVMEYEHVGFQDALELLARKAGISLEKVKKTQQGPSRAVMLDVMRWANEQYAECLLDSPQQQAEEARIYLGKRGLTGETVRQFGLGFAPGTGEWLVAKALNIGLSTEILEVVGLIAKRNEGRGHYDRFRDRVMFPIRDLAGNVVAFGGRILPSSPMAANGAPKYYNSAQTPIFDKSNQLYALDRARNAAQKSGTLVVVEGYMDVLMAHQHGIGNVVAPMGTALTAKHIRKLRGVAERVILIFDADAGGSGGVDRALELFVSQELDLRIGILPQGDDPCDVLVKNGAPALQKVFDDAKDVFEFKLRQVWPDEANGSVEQKRAAAEAMLQVLAAAPTLGGLKIELMVNRIAHRLGLKEETVWTRLRELWKARQSSEAGPAREFRRDQPEPAPEPRAAPAARHEVELLELLLAHPALVVRAVADDACNLVEHPGLRQLLEALLRLHADGRTPDLDHLHTVIDNERLLERALLLHDRGQAQPDPQSAYGKVLERFREKLETQRTQDLKTQVLAVNDHASARAVLAKLRTKPDTGEN
ncbi:MAG: DNA primase [Planctomycetota bacterium]